MSVSFNRDTSEPGDEIVFTVESSPRSYVGILAVDQSVLILKSGNDVTREEVKSCVYSENVTELLISVMYIGSNSSTGM